jgi:hypothetical protein
VTGPDSERREPRDPRARPSGEPTPEWLVERLRAGDLPPEEAARVRARLEAEGGLGRLDALRRADEAALRAHPPGVVVAEIHRRAGVGPPRRPRRPLLLVPALAAAAVAVFVAVRVPPGSPPSPVLEDGRPKGLASRLEIRRERPGAAPELLADGAAVRAGDTIQLAYVGAPPAGEALYGVVVSLDGRGQVTLHWPEQAGPAVPLTPGRAVPLPHAYRLDDAPAFERFFLVTSAAPFEAAAVVDAARRLARGARPDQDPLPVPPALAQRALLLVKVAP